MLQRPIYFSVFITACVLILAQCIGKKTDPRGPAFAGDAACISCHAAAYKSCITTAHFHASSPAGASMPGSFLSPGNNFHFPNNTIVKMEKQDSAYYQNAYTNGKLVQQAKFDVVVGQGRKAQTYLHWSGNRYFQLPLSWFRPVNNWANSPGFPATHPYFGREISSSCFGCHSSYVRFEEKAEGIRKTESFPENKVMYGINCERCHGPAQEHVAWHMQHPDDKEAHAITKIGSLNRQQQVDMCAVCHAGLNTPQRSLFEFRPGDRLRDYVLADYMATPGQHASNDVHGNQYQLLAASKCYRQSNQLTCNTCHEPHADNRTDMHAYSLKCMTCHQPEGPAFCKNKSLDTHVLQQNCVDCHMPVQPSKVITLLANGQQQPVADSLRSHLIRVYH